MGVAIMTYPSAASWFSELQQRGQLEGYAEEIRQADPEVLSEKLAHAHEYNAHLGAGRLGDPFADAEGPVDAEYARQLTDAPGEVMAELRIPALDVVLPVYHGTAEETLRLGIGHLAGSSLPVGGEGTHAVFTGHRGLPEAELFTRLDALVEGDTFTLSVLGETLAYRVTGSAVVEPDDVQSLAIDPGRDLVTLVTCTPLGVNSHRILVHAERVPEVADGEVREVVEATAAPVSFPSWMLVLGAAFCICLAVLIAVARKRPRPSDESAALGDGSGLGARGDSELAEQ